MSISKPASVAKINRLNTFTPQITYAFEQILKKTQRRQTVVSTVQEVVAHLKLLKCFHFLRKTVANDSATTWKYFITVAVRRFCLFMNGIIQLQQTSPDQESFNKELSKWAPPIDILLVWHSFVLDTKSFINHTKRNSLSWFYDYGFPLEQVAGSICNSSFTYNPSLDQQMAFESAMGHLILGYDITNCRLDQELFDIFCSVCSNPLATVPLAGQNGLADDNFCILGNCDCGFGPVVNRDELCKRKLWRDTMDFWFSQKRPTRPNDQLTQSFHSLVSKTFSQYIADLKATISFRTFKHLISFQNTNPIEATLQNNCFKLHDDLVEIVLQHDIFVTKVAESDWIFSDFLQDNLEESIERYQNLMQMVGGSEFPVVPTLDIDLVWSTHHLTQKKYISYTKRCCGNIVVRKVDYQQDMSLGLNQTGQSYHQKYRKEYHACFCAYCSYQRFKSRSLFAGGPRQPSELIRADIAVSYVTGCSNTQPDSSVVSNNLRKYNNDSLWFRKKPSSVDELSPILEDGSSSGSNTPIKSDDSASLFSQTSEWDTTPTSSLFEKSDSNKSLW